MKDLKVSGDQDRSQNFQQLSLLDTQQYVSPRAAVYDPYWDELEQEQRLLSTTTTLVEPLTQQDFKLPEEKSAPELPVVLEQFFADDNEAGNFTVLAPEQYPSVRAQVSSTTSKNNFRAQVTEDTENSAPEHQKLTHWVEKYWVQRGEQKYWYYRYRWMSGRKSHRIHLGSVVSEITRKRVEQVRDAISAGSSPAEIHSLISYWKEKS